MESDRNMKFEDEDRKHKFPDPNPQRKEWRDEKIRESRTLQRSSERVCPEVAGLTPAPWARRFIFTGGVWQPGFCQAAVATIQ